MFKGIKNINDVKHLFGIGQHLYFSCLFPKFGWFNKEFSINNIIAPIRSTIIKNVIFPDNVDNEDRMFLHELGMGANNVIRKFNMHVYLDNGEKFIVNIYEYNDTTTVIYIMNEVMIASSMEEATVRFYNQVVKLKVGLDIDDETTIIVNDNFESFKQHYREATELYPEIVIKVNDNKKRNLRSLFLDRKGGPAQPYR